MEDLVEIRLRVDDAGSESAYVELVGPGLFRLGDTPIWANIEADPLHAGDVIEAAPLPDGTHRFVRVVTRSPMRHYSWIVPRFFVESTEYRQFGTAVEAAGGSWQGAMGGALWAHVPPESSFDAEAELACRVAAARSEAPDA
jgi:hypothetical protein